MISLHDILSWLEPMPDDTVVGTACNPRDCAVARYVRSHWGYDHVHTRSSRTVVSPLHYSGRTTISHDPGVQALIEHLDAAAKIYEADVEITAGAVRETAARIIRMNQPEEAEGVLPS